MQLFKHRDLVVLTLFAVLSISLALAVSRLPLFELINNWFDDQRIANFLPQEPQYQDIVVVTITEETLQLFPYRAPIDRKFLSDLLRNLEQKGVRAIFLDVLFDQPTETTKDKLLYQTLRTLSVPLVVGFGFDNSGKTMTAAQLDYLKSFVPTNTRGLANLVKEQLDNTARWIYAGNKVAGGEYIQGAAIALVEKVGVKVPPLNKKLIAWRGAPKDKDLLPFISFPAHSVKTLPPPFLKDKIVLIGSDLTLFDRHRTPFSKAWVPSKDPKLKDGMPGVFIHAHSVAQLLDHRVLPTLAFTGELVLIVIACLSALLVGWLEIGFFISLIASFVAIIVFCGGSFALFYSTGLLIPLMAPMLGFGMAFILMMFYVGSEERKQKKSALLETRLKSEFLANMSHEIRTPMNAVIGMTELVIESKLDPDQHKYLTTVLSSAKALLHLLNDILDISKLEGKKMGLEEIGFDLRRVLDETISTLNVSAKAKALTLTLNVDSTLPNCFLGDPTRLRQVMMNLIGNAIKFTETGGITVVVIPKTEDFLRFNIQDTGIGIPEDRQAAIFESFTQVDGSTTRKHGGTGLGTTISKQIVELMQGRIWVESEIGKGSTFSFQVKLPTASDELCRQVHTDEPETANQRSFNILLAEDVEENITLAIIRLQQQGHKVSIARNGREVIDIHARESFDLILMDVNMPQMSGLDATREIRYKEKQMLGTKPIPIIAMTASAMKGDREMCLAAGMNNYVSKPIDFNVLLTVIQKTVPADAGTVLKQQVSKQVTSTESSAKLEGIDTARGLSIWGNAVAYEKSLLSFAHQHADDSYAIRQALDQGDAIKAKAIVHALKGVAGNLAITAVAETATRIDLALREESPVSADWVELLNTQLQGAAKSINSLNEKQNKPRTDVTKPTTTFNATEFALLKHLLENLEQGDAIAAETSIVELKNTTSSAFTETDICKLETLVDDFEFDAAYADVQTMINTLDRRSIGG